MCKSLFINRNGNKEIMTEIVCVDFQDVMLNSLQTDVYTKLSTPNQMSPPFKLHKYHLD